MSRAFEQAYINELTVNKIFGPGAPIDFKTGGKRLSVDSHQKFPTAYPTLAGALAACVNGNGDLIEVVPNHSETLTAALALNKTGVTIVCYGNGRNRPTWTINAAIPGFNASGGNTTIYNARIVAGSAITAATRLLRIAVGATGRIRFVKCRFEMPYDMYHMIVALSGEEVILEECEYENTVTTSASVHPQTAILNIGAKVFVKGGRFMDIFAKKAERWRACVEGGPLNTLTQIEKALFICRGIATQTRSAGASGYQATIDCRGISPSGNTAVGSIFTPTYQYIIETYNVAAVNKVGVITVTTSDIRFKTGVVYL